MNPNRLLLLLALAAGGTAQTPPLGCYVVPQARAFHVHPVREPVQITSVHARVRILETTASTTLEIALHNPAAIAQEAVLLLPVPDGAAVGQLLFDGPAPEATAKLLRKDEARALYSKIVAQLRDPALLEFAGMAAVRTSVFPVPANGRQRVQLTYEHVCDADADRCDYVLPRSESLEQRAPWTVEVELRSTHGIATVYSPSHEVRTERRSPQLVAVQLSGAGRLQPGSFRLSWLRQGGDLAASLIAYPDPKTGGGWFLLLAGLPAAAPDARTGLKREITLVLDRSGSMAGKKWEQARAAALQVLEGLRPGEAFQVIDYSTAVASFAPAPVRKDEGTMAQVRGYVRGLAANGGTNIHDALVEALRPAPIAGTLPIVLFLTDGLPTVGTTSEIAIRELVEKGNPHRRSVFTFGVGADVNAPLLDCVAEASRATSTYVLPEEDVEVKVGSVFQKLYGPALTDPRLDVIGADGAADTRRVADLHPARLPDLFEGDQLVLLGRYRGEEPLRLKLAGSWLGEPREFSFRFTLRNATTRNAFVPRLWAARRIAYLADQVRQQGAARGPSAAGHDPFADPQLRELRDEIVRLSTEFGVLSEYTAFLATEGTDLGDRRALVLACGAQLDERAMQQRSGLGGLNQGLNLNAGKAQSQLNVYNAWVDQNLQRVETTSVQQVCDRAFYRRGDRWLDGRLVGNGEPRTDEVIPLGSEAHRAVVEELVREGRAGVLSLPGQVVTEVGGRNVVIDNREGAAAPGAGVPPAGTPSGAGAPAGGTTPPAAGVPGRQ